MGTKEFYLDCYEKVVPRMVRGGILVADDAISRKHLLEKFLARALSDERTDAMVVPIGEGVLLARKR